MVTICFVYLLVVTLGKPVISAISSPDYKTLYRRNTEQTMKIHGANHNFANIGGRVTFRKVPKGMEVQVRLTGLDRIKDKQNRPITQFLFHLHTGRPSKTDTCNGVEGPYNPTGWTPETCSKQDMSKCSLGNLSGKSRPLYPDGVLKYTDTQLTFDDSRRGIYKNNLRISFALHLGLELGTVIACGTWYG